MPHPLINAIALELQESLANTHTMRDYESLLGRGLGIIADTDAMLRTAGGQEIAELNLDELLADMLQEPRDFGGAAPDDTRGLLAYSPYFTVVLRGGKVQCRTRFGEYNIRLRPQEIFARLDAGLREALNNDSLFEIMSTILSQDLAARIGDDCVTGASWPRVKAWLRRRDEQNDVKHDIFDVEDVDRMFMEMHTTGLVNDAATTVMRIYRQSNGTAEDIFLKYLEYVTNERGPKASVPYALVGKATRRARPVDGGPEQREVDDNE